MSTGTNRQNKNILTSKPDSEISVMMAELDNLEKGLSIEEVAIRPAAKKVKSLQDQIDEELALALEESKKMTASSEFESVVTIVEVVDAEMTNLSEELENILAFEPIEDSTENFESEETEVEADQNSVLQMNTKGHVNMSLEMGLGESAARVTLDSTHGIEINIEDLKLTIDSNNGCIIELKNGMNFTIPLSINDFELKKKVS